MFHSRESRRSAQVAIGALGRLVCYPRRCSASFTAGNWLDYCPRDRRLQGGSVDAPHSLRIRLPRSRRRCFNAPGISRARRARVPRIIGASIDGYFCLELKIIDRRNWRTMNSARLGTLEALGSCCRIYDFLSKTKRLD